MNDRNERKRIRGSNFTPEEELELIQNIITYQHIIESKELNASTRNEKDAAWNHISQIFNSKFSPRTTHQLRSKYDNMKTLARRFLTEKRNNTINLNNNYSPSNTIRSNIAMNIVLAIVTGKADNPNENIVNCNPEDLHFSEESSSYSDNSTKPVSSVTNEQKSLNDFDFKIKYEENYYSDKKLNNTPIDLQVDKPNVKTLIINTPAEINKNLEKNTNLAVPNVVSQNVQNLNTENEERTDSNSTNNNCASSKKRNPRLQELLRVKTLYLKRKVELIELENEERVKKMKREEELYAMQMKIMMLDVKIKQEELKKLQNS